jgi:diadenosine tetraphosphatase ApaH/serine/threonine PP2A family protein phosphatase
MATGRVDLITGIRSVGQPRDGNPWASWCLYDTQLMRVEIVRVAYDMGKTQKAMRSFGLPEFLINRLSQGL